jgi:two-component system, cell cycle response regulator
MQQEPAVSLAERRPSVLLVDHEPAATERLLALLQTEFDISVAKSGDAALQILSEREVDVIVADQRAPGMSDLQFLKEAARRRPDAKRLLLTAFADVDSLVQAINDGHLHYYLRKPWNQEDLQATISELAHLYFLEEENRRLLKALASVNSALAEREQILSGSLDDRGNELLRSLSRLRAANEELSLLAFRDGLSGLYNHRTFQERLREEVARSVRYGHPCSLLFVDIDDFKGFNDRFGHPIGDEVIRSIGKLLLGQLDSACAARESDIAARYGGDDFVLVLPETPKAGAVVKAERLRAAAERITVAGEPGLVTVSVGVAECPTDATISADLISRADQSMYRAKHMGRNRVVLHGQDREKPKPRPLSPLKPYRAHVDDACRKLTENGYLTVLYIDMGDLSRVEREYGSSVYAELLQRLGGVIASLSSEAIREEDIVALGDEETSSFVVFLGGPRAGGNAPTAEALEQLGERVSAFMQDQVNRDLAQFTRSPVRVAVGFSVGLANRSSGSARYVAQLVHDAQACARANRERRLILDKVSLQQLILGNRLRSQYQPIVDVSGQVPMGYEALIRGPRGTTMESAPALLEAAQFSGLSPEFDRACLRAALKGVRGLASNSLLFLNVLPPTLYDRIFVADELPDIVGAAGLEPSRIVLEVTEESAISNLTRFAEAVAAVRAAGFRIALDDVGAAHSNLQEVNAIAPNFIKLDRAIVDGVSDSETRLEVVRSMVSVALSMSAECIAEGIERPEDWEKLAQVGVKYMQGYLFARPGDAFPPLNPSGQTVRKPS